MADHNAQQILVCTPYRATTPRPLLARWHGNALALRARHPGHAIDICMLPDSGQRRPGDGRYGPHARARNALLDAARLIAYDYLYWIDVDVITWPEPEIPYLVSLLSWALANNPDGVTAPAVTLSERPRRFYDTLGYIERGHRARLDWPWFEQSGPIVELESVGCCYVIPAAVYRDGARYAETPERTEHESVMAVVRGQGRRIVANLDCRAVHAWLPDYGEALH